MNKNTWNDFKPFLICLIWLFIAAHLWIWEDLIFKPFFTAAVYENLAQSSKLNLFVSASITTIQGFLLITE